MTTNQNAIETPAKVSKITAGIVLEKSKFSSEDGTQNLFVVLAEGRKTGKYNVKVSVKDVVAKGQKAPKAVVGMRQSFDATDDGQAEARKYYHECVDGAKAEGWTMRAVSAKNVFSTMPKPGQRFSNALSPVLVTKGGGRKSSK